MFILGPRIRENISEIHQRRGKGTSQVESGYDSRRRGRNREESGRQTRRRRPRPGHPGPHGPQEGATFSSQEQHKALKGLTQGGAGF